MQRAAQKGGGRGDGKKGPTREEQPRGDVIATGEGEDGAAEFPKKKPATKAERRALQVPSCVVSCATYLLEYYIILL